MLVSRRANNKRELLLVVEDVEAVGAVEVEGKVVLVEGFDGEFISGLLDGFGLVEYGLVEGAVVDDGLVDEGLVCATAAQEIAAALISAMSSVR